MLGHWGEQYRQAPCYLGNSADLLPLLGWFVLKWLLSENIALCALQSFFTVETLLQKSSSIDLDIHSSAMKNNDSLLLKARPHHGKLSNAV